MQLRHFAGEKIARIANRVRAIGLSLLQVRVLRRLGFLQNGNVGVGVFPEGKDETVVFPSYLALLIRMTSLFTVPRAKTNCLPWPVQAKLKIKPVTRFVICLGGRPSTGWLQRLETPLWSST